MVVGVFVGHWLQPRASPIPPYFYRKTIQIGKPLFSLSSLLSSSPNLYS